MTVRPVGKKRHPSDQELLLLREHGLNQRRATVVSAHVAKCGVCSARIARLDEVLREFREARSQSFDGHLPDPRPARARLIHALAARAAMHPLAAFHLPKGQVLALAAASLAIVALSVVLALSGGEAGGPVGPRPAASFIPDPELTPGATTDLARSDLCGSGEIPSAEPLDRRTALNIFRSHGINEPLPRQYELDHLIPRELGGATAVENLWPQPYDLHPWNARAKDALEHRLVQLMCIGEVPLVAAQAWMARDWVAAYKKYFDTSEPLVEHLAYVKDEPWQ